MFERNCYGFQNKYQRDRIRAALPPIVVVGRCVVHTRLR